MRSTQLQEVKLSAVFDDEAEHLTNLRAQCKDLLEGNAHPGAAWLVASYLDMAAAHPAEKKRALWRSARAWLGAWAARKENARELAQLAPRSWALAELQEKHLMRQEERLDARAERALARKKRPFVDVREQLAYLDRQLGLVPKATPARAAEPDVAPREQRIASG